MNNRVVGHLQKLLLQERDALLNGHFDQITNFTASKEKLIKKIQREKISKSHLQKIVDDVSRNQSILEATILGIKSAQKHLVVQVEKSQRVSFYNKDGSMVVYNNSTTDKLCKY